MNDEQIAEAAIAARREALIAGAPWDDAGWIGVETIDRLVREETRRRMGLNPTGPGRSVERERARIAPGSPCGHD